MSTVPGATTLTFNRLINVTGVERSRELKVTFEKDVTLLTQLKRKRATGYPGQFAVKW